jgi:hypothetical protein
VPPAEIAEGIADAIDSDTFEHYLPDMKAIIEMKTSDFDTFLVGMRAMTDNAISRETIADATSGGLAGRSGSDLAVPGDDQ